MTIRVAESDPDADLEPGIDEATFALLVSARSQAPVADSCAGVGLHPLMTTRHRRSADD
jgi:hypothetical protein